MKNFMKNIYLKKLERDLRSIQNKKVNALKKSAEFQRRANDLLSTFLTSKILQEIADNNCRALAYRNASKSYSNDEKKVAEKIAKLKA